MNTMVWTFDLSESVTADSWLTVPLLLQALITAAATRESEIVIAVVRVRPAIVRGFFI
jgi:hypothetical protein